jgi:hypothetical protein
MSLPLQSPATRYTMGAAVFLYCGGLFHGAWLTSPTVAAPRGLTGLGTCGERGGMRGWPRGWLMSAAAGMVPPMVLESDAVEKLLDMVLSAHGTASAGGGEEM